MVPYYDEDGIRIYHGDMRECPEWLAGDVMVTDPPYGMALRSGMGGAFGDCRIEGDDDLAARTDALWAWRGRPALVFGRWSIPRPEGTRMVLTWDKGLAVGMGDLSIPWKPNTEEIYVLGGGLHGASRIVRTVTRHDAWGVDLTWRANSSDGEAGFVAP